MKNLSRRSFLSLGCKLTAMMGLAAGAAPAMADAIERLTRGRAPTLWLQGQCCSGCSISLLNSEPLGPDQLLTKHLALAFHQTLSGATGEQAVETVDRVIERGDFLLVVEGSIPVGLPRACCFGEETLARQVARAARQARAVIAVGTCATAGGIPAAPGNTTGAMGVRAFLERERIAVPFVAVPGCPAHPDWVVGTLAHVLQFGLPALDAEGRPRAFFAATVHEQCPRFTDYEREKFARHFGEEGCLFKLGCAGPVTKADCNLRQWNNGTNTCIRAGAPCIGCAWEGFAAKTDYPFYLHGGEARPGPA